MKTTARIRSLDRPVFSCPNAITWRQMLDKLINLALITAICAGFSASLVLLVALF